MRAGTKSLRMAVCIKARHISTFTSLRAARSILRTQHKRVNCWSSRYFPSDTAARFRQLDAVKEIIFGSWSSSRASIGLLAIRLVAGLGIALHGFPKIQNPFGWMGDALPG